MEPHRWNDGTPPTGNQPYSRPTDGQPSQPYPRSDRYPQQPGPYGQQPYGREPYGQPPWGNDQTAFIPFDREPYDRYRDDRYSDDRYSDDHYSDDAFAEDERRSPWYRSRSSIAVIVAAGLVLLLGTTTWLILRPSSSARQVSDPVTDSSSGGLIAPGDSPTPSASATTAAPTTQAAAPKPTAKKTTAKPRPTPTYKPPPAQLPPPPPAPVPTSSSCTQHPGPDASHDAVSTALASAGQQNYWSGVVPPTGFTPPLPAFSVPARLMDAFAWTESSWQSTVIACDGGIGLMQLMPDNVAYLNQRFGTNLDVHSLNGNAQLGATYIEWLTMYFGLYYFGSYDLMNATAPIQTGGGTLSLLDVVIAAYNVGPAALENDNGTPNDGSDDTLSIPNTGYVNRVNTAYANQPWL